MYTSLTKSPPKSPKVVPHSYRTIEGFTLPPRPDTPPNQPQNQNTIFAALREQQYKNLQQRLHPIPRSQSVPVNLKAIDVTPAAQKPELTITSDGNGHYKIEGFAILTPADFKELCKKADAEYNTSKK